MNEGLNAMHECVTHALSLFLSSDDSPFSLPFSLSLSLCLFFSLSLSLSVSLTLGNCLNVSQTFCLCFFLLVSLL